MVGRTASAAELVDANDQLLGTVVDTFHYLRTEGSVSFLVRQDFSNGFTRSEAAFVHGQADCSDERKFLIEDEIFRYHGLVETVDGATTDDTYSPSQAVGFYPAPPYTQMVFHAYEFPSEIGGGCTFSGGFKLANGNCCSTSQVRRPMPGTTVTVGEVATFDVSKFVPPFHVEK